MRQRNMRSTGQMIDYQMDQQGPVDIHPDPCIILDGVTNVLHSGNTHAIMAASGNFDNHHLPENYGNALYYGMTSYNGFQHHHELSAASNHFNSYMAPSFDSGAFSSSQSHGLVTDDYERNLFPDEYGRNNYFIDAVRGKRKNAENFPGNFQHFDASASSSSSSVPLNSSHLEFGINGSLVSMRSMSNAIGVESVAPHQQNHLVHRNYVGAVQRAGSLWLDQHPGCVVGEGRASSAWNHAPAAVYLPNNNVNGGHMETGNMYLQPPPPFLHHHHQNPTLPPPPPPLMQGVRGQNINFYPQMTASAFRHPINEMPHHIVHSQNVSLTGPRHVGPIPPAGHRIFRSYHGGLEGAPRNHSFPYLRILPGEEVAMLEVTNYDEVANYIDNHRDMRLDIEDMSYEELLALGEQIGHVNTGLTEESIRRQMKLRTYLSPATIINLEEEPSMDPEAEVCIICQSDYENCEKIGTLDCGHEYHSECLKKWLLVKNVCPICKSPALTTKGKDV